MMRPAAAEVTSAPAPGQNLNPNGPRELQRERAATTSKWVYPLLLLVFGTWVVSLAGIAALQNKCSVSDYSSLTAVRGFSAVLPCSRFFRFYWFIVAFEGALILGLAIALATGLIARTRSGWVGLFAVATLLYILMSDTFLTSLALPVFANGQLMHRAKVMAAGSIMTSAVNCLLLFALGMKLLKHRNNYANTGAAGYGPGYGAGYGPGATDKNTGGMIV